MGPFESGDGKPPRSPPNTTSFESVIGLCVSEGREPHGSQLALPKSMRARKVSLFGHACLISLLDRFGQRPNHGEGTAISPASPRSLQLKGRIISGKIRQGPLPGDLRRENARSGNPGDPGN